MDAAVNVAVNAGANESCASSRARVGGAKVATFAGGSPANVPNH